jgi:hypothetical protein
MKIHNLEDELNKVMEDMTKLKEKTEKLQKAFDDKEHWGLTMVAYMDACDEWGRFDDFVAEGGFDEDDMKHEWVQEWIKNTTEEESEEEEDEKDKYDGDDWGWVYGKNIVEREEYKEVVLIMAGGGDHWENWTITPTMNYIVNKDGKHPQHGKVLVQSSCGKYVSFQDEDYECDEDEGICEYELCVEC